MDAETSVRTVRILHGVFLATIVMFAGLGEFVPVETPASPEFVRTLRLVLLPAVVMAFGAGFFAGRKRADAAEEILMRDGNDTTALQQWSAGQIVSFACAESIALFGLAMRYLSGSRWVAAPFFVVAFFLMLLWFPRAPFQR